MYHPEREESIMSGQLYIPELKNRYGGSLVVYFKQAQNS